MIDSLKDLAALVERTPNVFLRYSEGPAKDTEESASCDYESDVMMPGLSVSTIAPEQWWPREAEEWIARRIRQYAQLGHEHGRYPWLLSDGVLAEAAARYCERFNIGRDSRAGDRSQRKTSVTRHRGHFGADVDAERRRGPHGLVADQSPQ